MNSLTFNEVSFHPIQRDGQIWMTSSELAHALGYKQENAVSKIFNRNEDEFDHNMTQIIKNPQLPNLGMRIFSLRGCHLIAMFAKTAVAKQFRKWVLDILDKEVQSNKTHKSERTALNDAVNMLVSKTKHLNYSEAYKLVHQRFNVEHIEDIPYDVLPVAVEYVHHLIALFGKVEQKQSADQERVGSLARHTLWLNHWWSEFGESIRKMSPVMGNGIHDHFKFGAEDARQIVGRDVYMAIFELAKTHNWHKGGIGYQALKDCGKFELVP